MSKLFSFALLLILCCNRFCPVHAQDTLRHMIRFYEDDDFMNIWFNGTDDAYTNGTRLDYFYELPHRSHSLFDKWMPGAGDSSIDTYGWGIMQLMYTPDNIIDPAYQPNDYPWSGALIGTHTRYSYNPAKRFSLQTELVMGVIGPAALDKPTQILVHKIIDYYPPKGWNHQFRNDLLLNVNFTAEKQLAALGSAASIIGGGQLYAGSMQTGAAIYPMLLIGKMAPYFNGFFSQYISPAGEDKKKKFQIYFYAKPELQLFFSNALLEGGIFTHNPNLPRKGNTDTLPYHALQPWVPSFTYGGIGTLGHFGISFSQIISAATMKGLYCHNYGNLSLYYGW